MRRRTWLAAVIVAVMVGAAGSAGAQRDRYLFEADSAAPGDTVRIEMTELPEMRPCFVSNSVVYDAASLTELRRFPQCKEVRIPPIEGRTLVGVHVFIDCNATYNVRAYRSALSREYRIVLSTHDGGCRGMRSGMDWLTLPPLPAGWTVRFVQRRLDDAGVFMR
jgi:hypothetical protein